MILKKHRLLWIFYLAALAAFAPFSTDIYLASMPIIQHEFQISMAHVQLTLSMFFMSFAIMQLFWGPLSDRLGRKTVLYMGIGLFVFGSLFCAWSQTIVELILSRIIQAVGACSGIVLAIAMVKDTFHDAKEMSRILSGIMSVMILAPMVAPILGSYLLVHYHWQSNFYFLALYGLMLMLGALFVHESHPASSRKPLFIDQLFLAYSHQLQSRPFLFATIAVATNFSVMFTFISSSSFIYLTLYHITPHLFGYFFAFNATALILGSLSLTRLKNHLTPHHVIAIALVISFLGAVMMLIALNIQPKSILCVVIPSFIATYGVGILYPELTSLALQHVVAYTGLASSLIGTFRFSLAAITGTIMGVLIHHSALPLAWMMLILNLITSFCSWIYFRSTHH